MQQPNVFDLLEKLIDAGDAQGIADLMGEAEARGEPISPYLAAMDAAARVRRSRPPVDGHDQA